MSYQNVSHMRESADAELSPGATSHVNDGSASKGKGLDEEEEKKAAQLIQRHYRGYRERRELAGMGLDASARWTEVSNLCFLRSVGQNGRVFDR